MDTGVIKEIPTSKVICATVTGNRKYYPTNFVPGPNDVIIGRGKKSFLHQGNMKLRHVVASKMSEYSAAATKSDKSKLLSMVVSRMQQSSPSGCRFVKEDPNAGGLWFDVGETTAREKVSQVFRDTLHDKYKSSNEFKKRKHRKVQCTNPSGEKPLCKQTQNVLSKEEQVDSEWENNDQMRHSLCWLDQSSGEFHGSQLFLALSSSLPDSSELTSWFEDDIKLYKPISVSGSLREKRDPKCDCLDIPDIP